MAKKVQDALKDIISLCKRRGFIFPGSEIYDGLANTWDYGPYGVELKRNIKNLWWKKFVTSRHDVLGLDSSILLNPRVWKASGHPAFGRLLATWVTSLTRSWTASLATNVSALTSSSKKSSAKAAALARILTKFTR